MGQIILKPDPQVINSYPAPDNGVLKDINAMMAELYAAVIGGGSIPFVRLNFTSAGAFRFTSTETGYNDATTDIFVTITDGSFFYLDGLTGGVDGRRVRVWNVNAGFMTVENNSGSAAAGNKIVFTAISANVNAGSGVELVYDATALSGAGGWLVLSASPPHA